MIHARFSLEILPLVAVEGDEDEEEGGEAPEGRTAVADERQRDAYDGHEADCHADVYEQVHEDAACDAVAVDAGECLPAPFGIPYYPADQEYIQEYDESASDEAPFFSDGAEDEVRALFRYEAVGGLGSVHVAFAERSA